MPTHTVCCVRWKHAKRLVCAGTFGSKSFPDLGVEFDTGCTNFAHAKQLHCKHCRAESDARWLIQGQRRAVGTETLECEYGQSTETKYVVECKDPGDDSNTAELLLPRAEVKRSILQHYEKMLLPDKSDHGNLRRKPMHVK